MYGGPNDLSGLSWNVSDQANWGFAIVAEESSGSPVIGIERNVGLRCTYHSSQTHSGIVGGGLKTMNVQLPTKIINIAP